MGISNNHKSSLGFLDNSVKSVNFILRECGAIEDKIFFVLSILNVAPQNIYRESSRGEIVASFNQQLSRVVLPLAKMKAKRIYARDWCVSRNFRKRFRHLFRTEHGAKDEEFHRTTFTGKTSVSTSTVLLRVNILEEAHPSFS